MKTIDAHMHLPVCYTSFQEKKSALLSEMKQNGISKGVVIADSEESSIGSTETLVSLFGKSENVKIVGAFTPNKNIETQLQSLEKHIKEHNIIGIKLFCGHENFYLSDARLSPLYDLTRKYNVPVLFHSGWKNARYASLNRIEKTALQYSDNVFVCCHCCYPKLKKCFKHLSKYDNIYFDLSSVADNKKKFSEISATVETYFPQCSDRILFGSDYASCSQKQHIDFVNQLKLSDSEKEKLVCTNAEKLYHL